jgi:hypothetical protein
MFSISYKRGMSNIQDPYYNNVSLLLHMNGANNSTTFTDSSRHAHTVSRFGNTIISTAQSKFGGSSAYFDGVGDYLSIAANSLFLPLANEDFTVEAWVYLTQTPGATSSQIVGTGEWGTNSDWVLLVNSSRQPWFYINSSPGRILTATSNAIQLNTWNHIAASRYGTGTNNLKLFVNGAIGAQTSYNATTDFNGNNLTLGGDANGDEANVTGYIDEVRITKGIGRYTSAFTPVEYAFLP